MVQENKRSVRLIRHQAIDYGRYDRCIENASNGLVYACSWYLDAVAGKWDILVSGDYDYVMPLPCRRKWGIRYVYLPPFLQQLGIFPQPAADIEMAFYRKLITYFRYVDYAAALPPITVNKKRFISSEKHTRILPLQENYPSLAGNFSENIRRNLKKSIKHKISFVAQVNTEDFFSLQKTAKEIPLPQDDWKKLERLMEQTLIRGNGVVYGAYKEGVSGICHPNRINAAAFFILWHHRAYYIMSLNNSEGRDTGSVFAIFDRLIRDMAGSGIILDFEGSSIPGVDRMFEGFGAWKEPYLAFTVNRLPFPFNLLKKHS